MRLPYLAVILGLGGVLPFMFLGVKIFIGAIFEHQEHISLMLLAYGACILSFLGAVHWGLAIKRPDIMPNNVNERATSRLDKQRLLLGVCPALWAWGSLCLGMFLNARAGFSGEIVGFIAVYIVERIGWQKGALPGGYLKLRLVLTFLVVLALFIAFLGAPPVTATS